MLLALYTPRETRITCAMWHMHCMTAEELLLLHKWQPSLLVSLAVSTWHSWQNWDCLKYMSTALSALPAIHSLRQLKGSLASVHTMQLPIGMSNGLERLHGMHSCNAALPEPQLWQRPSQSPRLCQRPTLEPLLGALSWLVTQLAQWVQWNPRGIWVGA